MAVSYAEIAGIVKVSEGGREGHFPFYGIRHMGVEAVGGWQPPTVYEAMMVPKL